MCTSSEVSKLSSRCAPPGSVITISYPGPRRRAHFALHRLPAPLEKVEHRFAYPLSRRTVGRSPRILVARSATMMSSASSSGTSTSEKPSAISIAPIVRDSTPASPVIAPTRSPGRTPARRPAPMNRRATLPSPRRRGAARPTARREERPRDDPRARAPASAAACRRAPGRRRLDRRNLAFLARRRRPPRARAHGPRPPRCPRCRTPRARDATTTRV